MPEALQKIFVPYRVSSGVGADPCVRPDFTVDAAGRTHGAGNYKELNFISCRTQSAHENINLEGINSVTF